MSTDKESSATGMDNCPPMLDKSDYESWRIRIERYIRGKPLGKLIWRSIQKRPTPHPQITMTEGQGESAIQVTRDKRDKEFTEIENNKELADIQATNILSQGLPRHVFNILNQTRTGKEIWDNVELLMKGSGKSLQQQKEELFDEYERFRAIGNESIHDYFVRFHKLINDMKITQLDIPTHQMNTKFVNNLPPYWAKYVTNVKNNKDISATTYVELYTYLKSYEPHAMKTLKKQEQSTSICKEKKRVKDSQYFKDKMLLMEAKEKGTVLDAEAEAFLADVECTAPYDQPLAITTTNMFEVSHEDAYDSDVDEGPHAAAAFMANLSSTSGTNGATTSQVNEVHTDANQIFDNVNHLLTHEMHQEEHLDSDVESDIDDNTIPYHQYQLDSDVQDVPTEVSSAPPGEISMITILDDLRTQLDGHLKVNQEQSLVNDSLRAELARCKQEMVSLERNKVKHDLDQTIIQRNKRNAELEEENVLLKSKLSQNVVSINSLKNESKKVVSEKKVLEDKYLEEIVCLKTTHDLHKKALGRSNPWNLKQAKLSQPTLYDGHALLNPTHTSVKVHDSEDSLVHAEVSRTKMSTRLGTIKPINYAELNALYTKEKGTVLDAEAEAFLADVEFIAPYDQPLAITTTNMFEVSHEDAYNSDVDEGPHAAAAFMANLSSISGTNGATTSQVNEEEHLDSDVESDIDDNTILYHQYQLDSDVQDVPTEVSSTPPGEISMITILDDLRTQLDGHLKVNQEQSLVNDSLRAELARCKHEIVSLERNKVKHDLDQTIIQRNKRNAELEEENVLLKSKLS
ncbi:hypothetical protein Tco_0764489 [Tanacetum coccineum]